MKFNKLHSAVLWGFTSVCLLTTLVACGSIFRSYKGLTVPAENLIALQNEGPHEGSWQTEDVSINYQYTKDVDNFKISGLIDFDESLKANYNRLDDFMLRIYFVNSENKIIGNLPVSPFTFFDRIEETSFKRNVVLPPDTHAMVFSYSGSVSEGGSAKGRQGEGGGGGWNFWKLPHE